MLKLERSYLDNCTIGKLYFRGDFICYTLERPWQNNEPNVSCIPSGTYSVQKYHSAKYPECFSLLSNNLGVGLTSGFHRTYILIHPANFVEELEGCIAPGLKLHPDKWGIAESRNALAKLRELIRQNDIDQIEIR